MLSGSARNAPAIATDLARLTDPASGLLESAADAMGGVLHEPALIQVDHRPGRGTTVAYRARVEWPDGMSTETFGARLSSGLPRDETDPGVLRLSDGHHEVQVWRFPADPMLPALASVCDRAARADLLRAVGLDPAGSRVRVVGYRPCRRAVVEITTPLTRRYVKVLRPGRAAGVHRRLALTRAAGVPTPRSLGWSDDGAVVLEALPGVGLRNVLQRVGRRACSPDALTHVLDLLPAELCDLPRRPPWSEAAAHYACVIASIVPELGDRAAAVAAAVTSGLDYGAGAEPVHGDFYEAQLLTGGGKITGLLDVDRAGPGHRVDDLACLLAHLSVLVVMAPSESTGVQAALGEWAAWFDRTVDRRQLRVGAAGTALSLAPGPYRAQDPGWRDAVHHRVALAEQWLAAARTAALPDFESALINASGPSHLA